jgi:hypothetical protein
MAETTTDHETIRKWAESKGGKPAAVDRTHRGGDVGIIRIIFPQAQQSEHDELVEITWDEFFDEFDKRNLALVYDDRACSTRSWAAAPRSAASGASRELPVTRVVWRVPGQRE